MPLPTSTGHRSRTKSKNTPIRSLQNPHACRLTQPCPGMRLPHQNFPSVLPHGAADSAAATAVTHPTIPEQDARAAAHGSSHAESSILDCDERILSWPPHSTCFGVASSPLIPTHRRHRLLHNDVMGSSQWNNVHQPGRFSKVKTRIAKSRPFY